MNQPLAPAVLISAVAAVAALGAVYATQSPEPLQTLVTRLATVPLTAVLAFAAWQVGDASIRGSRPQQAWQFIAVALAVLGVGDLVLVIDHHLVGQPVVESWAALGYLAYAPLMLCALLLLPPGIPSARERIKFSLDAATVVVGGAMIFWRFVIMPALSAPFDGSELNMLQRKRASPLMPNEKSSSSDSSNRFFCASVSTL
jgi:hypothetical protein